MHARICLAGSALFLLVLGCRDDSTAPPDSLSPDPQLIIAAAAAPAFSQVSVGDGISCGVTTSQVAYCWGTNSQGELGDGTVTERHRPVAVAGGLAFRQISAGENDACGVTTDFHAYCWGDQIFGALGNGDEGGLATPTRVAGGKRYRTVAAGYIHSCGVSYPDNRAYCWGLNGRGQLGNGTGSNKEESPVAVLGGHEFRQVTVGVDHSCGITTDNQAWCWGDNQFGQVGDGSAGWKKLKPVRVAGGHQFRQIDAGDYYTCAVTTGDRAYCWGRNEGGQLGIGTLGGERRSPVAVAGGLSVFRVTAGWQLSCGEGSSKRAYCWGTGFVGNGTTRSLKPAPVSGGLAFAQVSSGSENACGITTGSQAYCWGGNGHGQLGDGTTTDRPTPVPVAGPE
jgi:alpha-tubulin suppressor-like RCC1 family protein